MAEVWSFKTKLSEEDPDWIVSKVNHTSLDAAAEQAANWLSISAENGIYPVVTLVKVGTDEPS